MFICPSAIFENHNNVYVTFDKTKQKKKYVNKAKYRMVTFFSSTAMILVSSKNRNDLNTEKHVGH